MNLEDIKQYFEQNKDQEDVKAYLEGFNKITPEGVTSFLETEDGKKLLQPKLDSNFTKGLETWKGNNLQKLVDDGVKAINPDETPEQKEIRELKEKFATMEKEKARESLKNKALTTMNEKKLPTFLLENLIGIDDESTTANLTKFEEVWNAQKEEISKGSNQSFGNNGNNPSGGAVDLNNMSPQQLMSQAFSKKK